MNNAVVTAIGVAVGAILVLASFIFGRNYERNENRGHEWHSAGARPEPRNTWGNNDEEEEEEKNNPNGNDPPNIGDNEDEYVDANNAECGICLASFAEINTDNIGIYATHCGHIFCRICIQTALQREPLCPYCRRRVRPDQIIRLYFG